MSALTDYRNFIRATVGGFDGATLETAAYTQLRQVWTTPTDTRVGRWTPATLNRYNVVSVLRVMLQGVIGPGDAIRVRDSAGQIRFTRPASLETSGWFFMGPEDVLEIEAPAATSADILVNDLTDEQLQEWILSEITAGNTPVLPDDYSEITIAAPGTAVPAWTGRLMVFINFAGAPGDVVLPALADIALGDTVTFLTVPGSLVARIVTDTPASDEVNGLVTTAANEYYLRSDSQSVTYTRVTGGWQRRAGFPVAPRFDSGLVSPVQIPAFQEGTFYVVDEMTGAGDVLTLPALADCTAGCRIIVRISGAGVTTGVVHALTPSPGESINGNAAGVPFLYVAGPNSNASVVVAEHAGTFWSVHANTSDVPINSTIIAAGAIPAVGGKQFVRITLAADGDVTLPDPALLPLGSQVTVARIAGAGTPRIITHNGVVTVNGVAGVTATQWYLTSIGKALTYTRTQSGVWTRDQEWAQQQVVTISGAGIIPSVAGELIVNYDSGLNNPVILPALTSVPLGASIYIYRSGVGTPTITVDNAADNVNGIPAAGGNTWRLMNGGESVLYVRVPGGWWRNTPIVFVGISSAADITASTARTQYYRMTGGAGQALNLPALSTVDTGTTIYQFNAGGAAHTLVPNGTDLINNVNAAVANAVGTRTQIVSMGPTIGWITILSA